VRGSLNITIVVYAAALALWCVASALRNRPRSPTFTAGLLVLEFAVALQAVFDVVELTRGQHDEVATNLGYLLTSLILLPVTAAAVRMDRGRWGSAALAVGCVLVAVVSIRLQVTLGVHPISGPHGA
jgi:FtsH-binding integral membrane protein